MNNALLHALFADETAWCHSEDGPEIYDAEPVYASAATA
jgi:hypothetical protein